MDILLIKYGMMILFPDFIRFPDFSRIFPDFFKLSDLIGFSKKDMMIYFSDFAGILPGFFLDFLEILRIFYCIFFIEYLLYFSVKDQ